MVVYATGTASTVNGLLQAIIDFAKVGGGGGLNWHESSAAAGLGEAGLYRNRVHVRTYAITSDTDVAFFQALGYKRGVASVTANSNGSGYAVGDILTINSGTATTLATVEVTAIGGGGSVDGVRIRAKADGSGGSGVNYTVDAGSPSATLKVTGSGDDLATVNPVMGGVNSTNPWESVDDSGVGAADLSANRYRGLYDLGAGPFTSYHLFGSDSPAYIHVVVEKSPGVFRHVGFGELDKIGTWEGGEYCWGVKFEDPTNLYDFIDAGPFDALTASTTLGYHNHASGLHVEGLPNQPAGGKWGLSFANDGSTGNDRQDVPIKRVMTLGCCRGNTLGRAFSWMASNDANGFIPMTPNLVKYLDRTPAGADEVYPLGWVPDMRIVNMTALLPKEERTIGGEVWKFFPAHTLGWTPAAGQTGNLGFAFRKS